MMSASSVILENNLKILIQSCVYKMITNELLQYMYGLDNDKNSKSSSNPLWLDYT